MTFELKQYNYFIQAIPGCILLQNGKTTQWFAANLYNFGILKYFADFALHNGMKYSYCIAQ